MKSPVTGKEMNLVKERRLLNFRKESFEIVFHYYLCGESQEQYTTTELDEINMNQVFNQYRDKFNIPFPDEINRIRHKFGLSAVKMAEILGFGTNSYRQYEAGEMPSVANAKLIQMIDDPNYFMVMLELCSSLDEKVKVSALNKAQTLIEDKKRNLFQENFKKYLLGNHIADIYSGYRNPNLEKFTEMVVYFSQQIAPFKTKMNKLLFFADFLMFKQSCFSISGVRYKAINLGPVPNNFQSIFEYMANNGDVEISSTEFPEGYTGEQFKPKNDRMFRLDLFSEQELSVLEYIAKTFQSTSTGEIISLSHLEEAWIKNEKGKGIISYEFAFDLNLL